MVGVGFDAMDQNGDGVLDRPPLPSHGRAGGVVGGEEGGHSPGWYGRGEWAAGMGALVMQPDRDRDLASEAMSHLTGTVGDRSVPEPTFLKVSPRSFLAGRKILYVLPTACRPICRPET